MHRMQTEKAQNNEIASFLSPDPATLLCAQNLAVVVFTFRNESTIQHRWLPIGVSQSFLSF